MRKRKCNRPKVSLADLALEYEIEVLDKDKLLLDSALNILQAGVGKVSIVAESSGNLCVEGNYEQIACRNVKAKFTGKSYFDTKTECKLHIQTSHWYFPCPDHKYSNIKRNLEHTISELLKLYDVEVLSFDSDIIEYDVAER